MQDATNFARGEPRLDELFAAIESSKDRLVADIRTISEVPAPTFAEHRRTSLLLERLPRVGLRDVHALPLGSVVGYSRGRSDAGTLLLASHIDTVFPDDTDLTTRIDGDLLRGPGTGDNASGVAATLHVLGLMHTLGLRPACNVAFAGTVGEEGRGGLRGMKEVLDELGGRVSRVIAVDGDLDTVVDGAVAIRRYEVTIRTAGGHAWSDFGAASAVHAMSRIVADVADLETPRKPRTTLNVGTIVGGSTVNSIAQSCTVELELRSLDSDVLAGLDRQLLAILQSDESGEVQLEFELVDDRPGGVLAAGHPLRTIATESAAFFDLPAKLRAASTDATIPLARDVPAICIGVQRGNGVHTTDECLEIDSLVPGCKRLALALLMAAGGLES